MGYLYRFLDENNNILYIGKTEKDVITRLRNHNHLPKDCYEQVVNIEYAEVKLNGNLAILEIYLINKYIPPYNNAGKDIAGTSLILDTSFLEWHTLDLHACGIKLKSKKKTLLTPEERKEHQRIGIERAKAQGKYKGRKRIDIDKKSFIEACTRWRDGKCTAKSIYEEFNISSQTFYRRVHEWNL